MSYSIRRPISSDRLFDSEAMTVSHHTTMSGALRALARQRRWAASVGGYSQDFLWDEEAEARVSVDARGVGQPPRSVSGERRRPWNLGIAPAARVRVEAEAARRGLSPSALVEEWGLTLPTD